MLDKYNSENDLKQCETCRGKAQLIVTGIMQPSWPHWVCWDHKKEWIDKGCMVMEILEDPTKEQNFAESQAMIGI